MKHSRFTALDLVQIALVAALYVLLTALPVLSNFSYGAVQFRISEMLNFLAFYNPKYILSVTIGCMIANFISPQSLGLIDVVVGGGSTFIFVSLGVYLFKRFDQVEVLGGLFRLDHLFFSVLFSISMITIAWELNFVLKDPFFLTWFTTAIGEFTSLLLGAFLVKRLDKVIDFTK
ncbi:QueT transporter family protein [Streptococcus sp. DD13]|uniref:QueT transporter family protein n=1 Tax=Streptococcus sp. DD13 TaxID=1777881 RepID=UPI00079AC9B2|nr:QueT transporter family protein [Streptococcus sp. DD13]KXT78463.1 Substrate-specific component QueT of putative queuosine-regulated ECF transporter [Streptococcus sp. DD13]